MKKLLRRARPWLLAWTVAQVAIRVGGAVMAGRLNSGDESSTAIRRVVTQGRLALTPRSAELRRVELDAVMAGIDLDLMQVPGKVTGGVDVVVRAAMAGVQVIVPPGWKVWWESTGPGGIGPDRKHGVERAASADTADLRVHGSLLFAGIGLSTDGGARRL